MQGIVSRSIGGGTPARSWIQEFFPDHNGSIVEWQYPGPTGNPTDSGLRTKILLSPGSVPGVEAYTPNSEGSKHSWKPFEHYKVRETTNHSNTDVRVTTQDWFNYPAFSTGIVKDPYYGYSSDIYGAAGRLNAGLPEFYVPRESGGFVPPPSLLENLQGMALRQIMPVLKADLSILNFVYELKDFKSLPSLLKDIGEIPKVANLQTLKNAFATLRRQSPGIYLQHKFNIQPLLSDISSIFTALSREERRLNDFISRAGRVQSRHFTYNWAESDNTDERSTITNVPGTTRYVSYRRLVEYRASAFHVELLFNYNYTTYQIEHARLLAFLDRFGLNLNPVIIWNAIPWSFVVDWVIGVNRLLDSMKATNMAPTINILNGLWSIRRERDIKVSREWDKHRAANSDFGEVAYMPIVTETAYRRTLFLPDMSSIQLSGVSPQEVTLGAALVLSRKWRIRGSKPRG